MIQSMTAFASRTGQSAGQGWIWEMRAVNGRGLDLRFRLPEGLDAIEAQVRTILKGQVARGSLTVSLRLTRTEDAVALALDEAQLDRVLMALDVVQQRAFDRGVTLGQATAADVLGQRGVIAAGAAVAPDPDALAAALMADFQGLLADFQTMRRQEGQALHDLIAGHLAQIADLVDKAALAAEDRRPAQAEYLRLAIARVLGEVAEVDPDRLAQELALLAVKQDVTEEIDRLRTHVAAARTLLDDPQPAGRKFDFLAQEFNREANTLCAKAQNGTLTAIGLDLKAVIDQIREQIQNVE